MVVRPFAELIAEAEAADVDGWGFGWLAGRATEERPPWGFAGLLAEHLASVNSALDIDTGGGEVVGEADRLPARMVVTEGWPANAARARALLESRGVTVIETAGPTLPFEDASFDLVSSRHPVAPNFSEIARVLRPSGRYVAQHVGPRSAAELIEFLTGPQPGLGASRHPSRESAAAEAAGLTVERLETARCRMEFFDIGAVVWVLRKCVWWVPDFTVPRYERRLRELDERMRAGEPFVAHSTRHLLVARR